MTFLYFVAIAGFLFISLLLCLVVLVQEGKGGGLGTSLGGGDTSDSVFGTSTPEVLKSITGWLAVGFITFCLVLSFWTSSLERCRTSGYANQTEITQ
jgi:preprotein translocase subunit SecG